MTDQITWHGATLIAGSTEGPVIRLAEPLSFWGGFDAATGCVIDRRHPDRGRCLSGAVLVMTAARGSSSGSSVLAEAIRAGTAPAAFVLASRDPILTVGAAVARDLYGKSCPIVVVDVVDFERIGRASRVDISAELSGAILISQQGHAV